MTGDQLLLFVAVLVGAGSAFFALFEVVPSIARDRLLLALYEINDELDELQNEDALFEVSPDVQLLRYIIQSFQHNAAPIGLTWLIAAKMMRRQSRARFVVESQLYGISSIAFEDLERRAVMQILRASFFASRFWLVTGPIWLVYRYQLEAKLRREEERYDIERAVYDGLRGLGGKPPLTPQFA